MTPEIGQTCHWERHPDYIEAHRYALKETDELIDTLPHLTKKEAFREIATSSISIGFSYLFEFLVAPRRLECN